jgi:hypothetical protein
VLLRGGVRGEEFNFPACRGVCDGARQYLVGDRWRGVEERAGRSLKCVVFVQTPK